MKDFKNDYLFPSFITSAEVENLNNVLILEECYRVRDVDPQGVRKSNIHNWHSEVFSGSNTEYENLNKLSVQAMGFANQVLDHHQLNQRISRSSWWININPQYTYNVIHSHPKTDLSVVYYAKVASGGLVLMRNDGAMHTDLFAKQSLAMRFEVEPVVGRFYAFPSFLLHQVLNNLSTEDRVSIAFNMTI